MQPQGYISAYIYVNYAEGFKVKKDMKLVYRRLVKFVCVLHEEIESGVEPGMTYRNFLCKQYALARPSAKSFLAPLRSLYLSC